MFVIKTKRLMMFRERTDNKCDKIQSF